MYVPTDELERAKQKSPSVALKKLSAESLSVAHKYRKQFSAPMAPQFIILLHHGDAGEEIVMQNITGIFEKGERGAICRRPSDRGAWIVPDRASSAPENGVEYVLEVTGTAASGKLRFARIVETVKTRNARLAQMVQEALADESRLVGVWACVVRGVNIAMEGRAVIQLRVFGKDYLDSETLGYRFRRTDAASAVIERARLEYERAETEKVAAQTARETQWRAEAAAKREAQVAEEAPLVAAFFADHPEARDWFKAPPETLLFNGEVAKEAVKRGLAKKIGKTRGLGGVSYRHKFFADDYSIVLGGKEVFFSITWDDDEYDD